MSTSLVLRVCDKDLRSHNGFQWPDVGGIAIAPDWSTVAECGTGLHGWLHGEGDHRVANITEGARWLVVEVDTASLVMLGGKCKFPRGTVRFVGDMHAAAAYLIAHDPLAAGLAVIGASRTVGDNQAVVVGAFGCAVGGYGATVSGGDGATVSGGYGATVIGGYGATVSGGDGATVIGGYGATVSGGYGAELRIRWWDEQKERYRTGIAYVGENGIEPNVAYKLDGKHKFVRADK